MKIYNLFPLFLIVLIACSAVYCGFDFDKLINRPDPLRERVIPVEWIEALNYIRCVAKNKNFVIVSDIYFGKLAAGYLGLRRLYPPGSPVHVNVGNKISWYFYKIALNPYTYEQLMIEIMNITNSEIGFYVIDDYWVKVKKLTTYEKIDQLKIISDEWREFGNKNKIYVFKVLMPILVHRYVLYFDGLDDYIEVPNSSILNPQTITLEALVKPFSIDNQDIINKWYHHPKINAQYRLSIINGRFGIRLNINGVFYSCFSQPFQIGKWYHVVGTFDGFQIKIYINGVLSNVLNATGSLNMKGALPLRIGIYGDCISNSFKGYIAFIRIYNRALTLEEVVHNYKHPNNPIRDGLILWLSLDDGSRNIVCNRGYYNLTGLINGAQWVKDTIPMRRDK